MRADLFISVRILDPLLSSVARFCIEFLASTCMGRQDARKSVNPDYRFKMPKQRAIRVSEGSRPGYSIRPQEDSHPWAMGLNNPRAAVVPGVSVCLRQGALELPPLILVDSEFRLLGSRMALGLRAELFQ